MEQRSFYHAYGEYIDELTEGAKLKLEHTVEYDYFFRDVPEMAPLIVLPISELLEKRRASVKLEKEIYANIQGSVKEWEKQAAQTLLLDKALEYVRTPTVEHTSNEWKQQKDGSWEISNLVYKMSYKIWEDTKGDKTGTWLVSWELEMNCPTRPSAESMYYAGESTVAEQKRKRYDSFDAAQRYIQGRFDLYAPLFTVLSPPIPDKFKNIFRINGSLLPGYTIAPPEKMEPDKDAVDALLDCLGDEDIAVPEASAQEVPAQEAPKQEAKPSATPSKGSKPDKTPAPFKCKPGRRNTKKSTHKKKPAPQR